MTSPTFQQVETASPRWVAVQINRLAPNPEIGELALRTGALAVAALLVLVPDKILGVQPDFFSFFFSYLVSLRIVAFVLAFSAIFLNARDFLSKSPVATVALAFIALSLRAFWNHGNPAFVENFGVCAFMLISLWILMSLTTKASWYTRLALFISILMLAFFVPGFFTLYFHRETLAPGHFLFETLLFVSPLLVTQSLLRSPSANLSQTICFALSPIQCTYQSLPIPMDMLPPSGSNRKTAARGLCNILGGITSIFVAGLINLFVTKRFATHGAIDFLTRGWLNYLFFYFGFLGTLHIAVGTGRWIGYDLRDPADHALLATNLIDRWKKWNFFFYWYYMTFVWLPIVRKTRLIWLATLFVFGLDFFWHNVREVNRALFSVVSRGATETCVRQFIFFMGQALLLYISYAFQRRLPSENKRTGWIGVALTHFAMAAIYGVI